MDLETLKSQIKVNKLWAVRALLAVYAYQTLDEKTAEGTYHNNCVGFNSADARIMTSCAKRVLNGLRPGVTKPGLADFGWYRNGEWCKGTLERALSPRQWEILHLRLPKYAKQLLGLSKATA